MKSFVSKKRSGFTLIELLAVITIIVILAGIVVGGLKFAQERQARDKAKLQVSLIEKALEEYKLDNGSYPAAANPTGAGQSNMLYRALYWDGASDATRTRKIYVPELDPATTKQGWIEGTGASATIKDPWGQEYRYRAGNSAVNPDFDFWSVGKDGKTSTSTTTPDNKDTRDDIRNF
jgi:general secretion pathway protein G